MADDSNSAAASERPIRPSMLSTSLTTPAKLANPEKSYWRFLRYALFLATEGSSRYYIWMTVLTVLTLLGINAWAVQVSSGMAVTAMTDHVSWGLYIANFTFMVGVAAAAVMMVIPAYLYKDHDMHDAVIVGELLAIAAIVMCIGFVVVDLGRPDRFWHMLPFVGKFNWPESMLTWDILVLNGYLLINLHITGYMLYCRYKGERPNKKWYLPFVWLSIFWAVSIHSVTAFLYCGLGGRPFWNTALMAPRFLASAFVAGPAFIIIGLQILRRMGDYPFGDKPIQLLLRIVRVTCLINLFMLGSEIFTVLYAGNSHAGSLKYLLFGSHGKWALVPWMWSAIALNVIAACIFFVPDLIKREKLLIAACAMTFVGIWIEKGMGLIIPGFIPSTLHEYVEYVPTWTEWQVSIGIWALGLMVFTVALKVAIPVLSTWTPAMATGHAHVDQQHQGLFLQLNVLIKAIREGADANTIHETIGFLEQYTAEHFRDEETIMQKGGYPKLAGHQRLHQSFIDDLQKMKQRLAEPEADINALAHELHDHLREWLVQHITTVDRGAMKWLRDHAPEEVAHIKGDAI